MFADKVGGWEKPNADVIKELERYPTERKKMTFLEFIFKILLCVAF